MHGGLRRRRADACDDAAMRSPDAAGPEFRRVPLVCGALGAWDEQAAGPWIGDAALRVVHRSAHGLLLAGGRKDPDRERTGWTWAPVAETGPMAQDWRGAADEHLRAGFWSEERGYRLHTDALGLQDLYVREHRGALYFATRASLLTGLSDELLHVDWDAWGASLAFCAPVGSATGFREIRRATAGASWSVDAAGTVRREAHVPGWLQGSPRRPARRREVLAAIADGLPRSWARTAVPLSGGWDSRLLAALHASSSRRRPVAWTIAPDDGRSDDVQLARPVARALRLRHHIVTPERTSWADAQRRTLARTEHETWLHGWLLPLAEQARGSSAVIDGLAGDVLLKNLFMSCDFSGLDPSRPPPEAVWRSLGGRRLQTGLAPAMHTQWMSSTRDDVAHLVRRWEGHHAAATVVRLMARTFRAIVLSPARLFEPETRVYLPFVTPAAMSAALSVPVERKHGGRYYRRLLAQAHADVGRLPSTNDPGRPPPVDPARTSPHALEALLAAIRRDEVVCALLSEEVRRRLSSPAEVTAVLRGATYPLLAWAAMLADWRRAHRDRISTDDLPAGLH